MKSKMASAFGSASNGGMYVAGRNGRGQCEEEQTVEPSKATVGYEER